MLKIKKLTALILAILSLTAFVSCANEGAKGSSSVLTQSESVSSQKKEPQNKFVTNPLTGEKTLDPSALNKRPVGIMINNIKVSLPQRGISEADILYEVPAEGGITRILALFPDLNKIPDVGSVRSARHYYLSLAMGHDAVFVHFGGSSYVLNKIKNEGIKTINFLSSQGSYRDQNRVGKIPIEHTAFTSGDRLKPAIEKKGISLSGKGKSAFTFGDTTSFFETSENATNITVPFSSYTKATFTYDADSGKYKKGQFGAPQIDEATGKTLEVKNVFILKTSIKLMDNNSKANYIDVDLSEGEGYYAVDGKIIPIKWKKGGEDGQMRFYTADNKFLSVAPGKSWICILSKDNTVSYN